MPKSALCPVIFRSTLGVTLLFGLFTVIALPLGAFSRRNMLAYIASPDGQYQIYALDIDRSLKAKARNTDNVNVFIRSPDGEQIAFATSQIVNREPISPSRFLITIYIMDATGQHMRQITQFQGQLSAVPDWSPDGSHIAYSANLDGQSDIYLLDVQSGAQQQMTDNHGDNYGAVWSPDGQRIAYVSQTFGHSAIYVLDAVGDQPPSLIYDDSDGEPPVWSPDGQQLVFVTGRLDNSEIMVSDSSGGSPRPLTINAVQDYAPVWSPDGTQIAFMSQQNGAQYQINVMKADGSQQHLLVESRGAILENLVWSPDSRQIAYTVDRDLNQATKIVAVNVDGSGDQVLTPYNFTSRWPVWWPR